MMGERPDYDLDIFALLADLVERPAGPTCDICLYVQITLGVFAAIFFLLCYLIYTVKHVRLQYSPGTI